MKAVRGIEGFSLLGELISISLIVTLFAGSAVFFQYQSKMAVQSRAYASRDKLQTSLRDLSMMPTALRNSVIRGDNLTLQNCTGRAITFDPAAVGDCIHDQRYDFYLYGPIVNNDPTASSAGAIAGIEGDPARYDLMGVPCADNRASEECPLEAISYFKPKCPPLVAGGAPVARCDVAEVLEVFFEIRKAASVSSTVAVVEGVQIPFKTIVGSSFAEVKGIRGLDPFPNPDLQVPPPPAPPPASPPPSLSPPDPSIIVAAADPSASPDPLGSSGGSVSDPSRGLASIVSSSGPSGGGVVLAAAPPPPPPSPPPPPPPLNPVSCPGDMIQTGPLTCTCPLGQELRNPKTGNCVRIAR